MLQVKTRHKSRKKVKISRTILMLLFEMTLSLLSDENVIILVFNEKSWLINSGTTSHVTLRKDIFSSYTPVDSRVLKIDNTSEIKVFGIGTVRFKTNNDSTLVLHLVKHASNFSLKLISTLRLDVESYYCIYISGK